MNRSESHLLLIAAVLFMVQRTGVADGAKAFTDRDLQKYEKGRGSASESSERPDGPESLWPGIETWLELSEVESLIERTKGDRDRRVDELTRAMEVEKADCTGVVGAEYRFDGGVYGILVNATARKNCELAVERKYDTLIKDTVKAAGERLQVLSSRKHSLEARQRSLEGRPE